MMRSVAASPCAERRLDGWIEPLLGRDPLLQQRQVDTSEGSGSLDSRQRAERYARTTLVHRQEQGANGAWVHHMRSLQEIHPIHPLQVKFSRDQGDVLVTQCQVLERLERCVCGPGR